MKLLAFPTQLWKSAKTTLGPMAPYLLLAGRFFVGVVFLYSGYSKLTQPSEYFELAISFYQVVPESLLHPIALVLPWFEYLMGAFLIVGYAVPLAGGILSVLTALFQLLLGQALVRRLPIDECGCFGGGFIHLSLYQSFMLDTALLLILIQIATSDKHLFSLDAKLH